MEKKVVLTLGASLTEGFVAMGAPMHPYSIVLESLLGSSFRILRFGCSGMNSQQIRSMMPAVWPSMSPYFGAIVLCGSNDLFDRDPKETISNLEAILVQLREHCGETNRVVAVTLPQMAAEIQFPRITRSRTTVNEWMRSFAAANGLILVDFDSRIPGCCSGNQTRRLWSSDGLHMTPEGYDALGRLIYDTVHPFWG